MTGGREDWFPTSIWGFDHPDHTPLNADLLRRIHSEREAELRLRAGSVRAGAATLQDTADGLARAMQAAESELAAARREPAAASAVPAHSAGVLTSALYPGDLAGNPAELVAEEGR